MTIEKLNTALVISGKISHIEMLISNANDDNMELYIQREEPCFEAVKALIISSRKVCLEALQKQLEAL